MASLESRYYSHLMADQSKQYRDEIKELKLMIVWLLVSNGGSLDITDKAKHQYKDLNGIEIETYDDRLQWRTVITLKDLRDSQ